MFFLHREQMKPQSRKPDGNMGVFTINNVGRDDGGRYCCSYRPELFISSETSNYVEMLVLGEGIKSTFSGLGTLWIQILLCSIHLHGMIHK